MTAALSGDLSVTVGNILGGIVLQTVVLVVLDRFSKRGKGVRPLSYRAASLTLVIEAATVLGVLAVVVAGIQLPAGVVVGRIIPSAVLITLIWVVGLLLVRQAGRKLPWRSEGDGQTRHRTLRATGGANP